MGRFTCKLHIKIILQSQFDSMMGWLPANGYSECDTNNHFYQSHNTFIVLETDMRWYVTTAPIESYWTYDYFKTTVNMTETKQIDFTVLGTKLPNLANIAIRVSVTNWKVGDIQLREGIGTSYGMCSHGTTTRHGDGITYVIAEREGYGGGAKWEIPLPELNRIASEQGMFGQVLLGYKVPYDLYDGAIKAGDILHSLNYSNEWGVKENDDYYILPKELVTKWEAVFEENKPVEEILTLGSTNIKINIRKNTIEANGGKIPHHDLQNLILPRIGTLSNSSGDYLVELVDASYKIGCSIFTLAEIKTILATYKKFNK